MPWAYPLWGIFSKSPSSKAMSTSSRSLRIFDAWDVVRPSCRLRVRSISLKRGRRIVC